MKQEKREPARSPSLPTGGESSLLLILGLADVGPACLQFEVNVLSPVPPSRIQGFSQFLHPVETLTLCASLQAIFSQTVLACNTDLLARLGLCSTAEDCSAGQTAT